jgi:ferredoxin--NADP+ reductase
VSVAVAIVGSGPAGFYAADALLGKLPGCRIDILDRLPTPFGLVRAGVAPDHLSTKNVIRLYEKILDKDGVRLLGNVGLGRDVSYDELKRLYDVVVLAFGAEEPRRLCVPGEDRAGVVNVTDFVGWYNAVPGARDCAPDLAGVRGAVVIGNGNVALDVARLLAKTAEELARGDIAPPAAAAITAAPITDIWVIGRRGPVQSSFSFPVLSEFSGLVEAMALVDPGQLPADASAAEEAERRKKEKNLQVLKILAANSADDKPVRIHFAFCAAPVAVLGEARMTGLELMRNRLEGNRAVATGETFRIDAQLMVPTIGYRVSPIAGLPFDSERGIVANRDGRVEPGVYVVGWAKRGPTGVVGTNRVDSRTVVELIAADGPKAGKPGGGGLDELLRARGVRVIGTADWRIIDAAERARGRDARPREKLATIEAMLAVLDSEAAA